MNINERQIKNGNDVFEQWLELYKAQLVTPPKPIATGIEPMDWQLKGGFRPGQLVVIGGLPGAGKTAITLQTAAKLAKEGFKILVYNFEMTEFDIINKIMARDNGIILSEINELKINPDKFRKPEGLENIYFGKATSELKYEHILKDVIDLADGNPDITPIIIVDYLNRLPHLRGENKEVRITINENLSLLKQLALDTQGVVIMLAALSTEASKGGLTLNSYRESGEIAYASDVCMILGTAIKKQNKQTKLIEWTDATIEELQGLREETNIVTKITFFKVKHHMEGSCLLMFYRNFQNFGKFKASILDNFSGSIAESKKVVTTTPTNGHAMYDIEADERKIMELLERQGVAT